MELAPVIQAVDAHAAGEPGRVIVDGVSGLLGDSVMEKRLYLAEHGDRLRRLMLTEPRGYPALCCNLVVPSQDPRADWGFIIMEQTEYPAMSGSNTICVATVLIETGMVEAREPVTRLTLEAPAGLIEVSARVRGGKVTSVTFENVPAFAAHLDATLEVPGIGSVLVDVAWGGMFYVIAEAEQFGLSLKPNEGREISRIGESLRQAAFEQLEARHPELPQISGVSISQLSGPPHLPSSDRRNAVVVSTGGLDWARPGSFGGVLDRSPCGTGTCAKMAVLHARGELKIGGDFVHEGVLGTVFSGKILRETNVAGIPAIVPSITGTGWITGYTEFFVDPSDPFQEGFTVGDLWGESR